MLWVFCGNLESGFSGALLTVWGNTVAPFPKRVILSVVWQSGTETPRQAEKLVTHPLPYRYSAS